MTSAGDRPGPAVVGTVGAEPAELARLLGDCDPAAGSAGSGPAAGVLALDLSTTVGDEERRLLAGLAAGGGPVALAGVGAGLDPGWPGRLAAARAILDPGRRLPVFAVCLEAARAAAPGAGDGGVAALAAWCADPDSAAGAGPEPAATPGRVDGTGAVRAAAPAPDRAERLAGARAGFAQVRAATAADLRAGAAALTAAADEAAAGLRRDRPVFAGWLHAALAGYSRHSCARLSAELDLVCGAALLGLPRGDGPASGSLSAGPAAPPPVPLRPAPRRAAAEDALVLVLGASAGLGLGRMLVAPLVAWAGLGAAGTVLTVLAGLAAAAGVVGVRRAAAETAALRRGAAEAVAGTRNALESVAAARIGAAEARLSRELWNRTRPVSVQPFRDPDPPGPG